MPSSHEFKSLVYFTNVMMALVQILLILYWIVFTIITLERLSWNGLVFPLVVLFLSGLSALALREYK